MEDHHRSPIGWNVYQRLGAAMPDLVVWRGVLLVVDELVRLDSQKGKAVARHWVLVRERKLGHWCRQPATGPVCLGRGVIQHTGHGEICTTLGSRLGKEHPGVHGGFI